MKFSERWLREWVDPGIDTVTLCQQLTDAGLEVDNVETAVEPFTGIVVGEVVSATAHPNADKLTLCQVSDGSDIFQVICGAPNVRAGMKAAFARIGAVLRGDLEIKPAELRGVESNGMLCSVDELGLGEGVDGILMLPDSFEVGMDLKEVLALDDTCIDLDLTPNRGDCLSLRGVAREVGVLNDVSVVEPDCSPVAATIDATFPVEILAGAGCPRYLGRVIKNVEINRETPLWITEHLRRSGLRAIDPVVDVTNYVMMELGQPMHAFDLARLTNGIEVRKAFNNETLSLLDGSEVKLDTDTLLIADGEGPIAIAGVMGGERSGVRLDTKDVFLECAYFAPVTLMGTGRRYGLQTDASQRYERGVDYALQEVAMERATKLLIDIVGGEVGPVVVTESAIDVPAPHEIYLRRKRLDILVGETIPEAEVAKILSRLELSPRRIGEVDPGWRVTVPSHRFDLAIEEDLVEEVCRIYGYNRVASSDPEVALPLRSIRSDRIGSNVLADVLVELGYQEAITYSFVEPAMMNLLDPGGRPTRIANPMSRDQSVMRTNLFPGLIGALRDNLARQRVRIRLFEFGQCFPNPGEIEQVFRLGGVVCGARLPESWSVDQAPTDFFDLKGDIERLLEISGKSFSFHKMDGAVWHPGQSAMVKNGDKVIGHLGRLHPEIEVKLDLGVEVFFFEFDGDSLIDKRKRRYSEISRFPSVRRDLAVVVDRSVLAGAVETAVREIIGDVLVELRLFDAYQGKGIDSNQKSLGFGLTLQDASRTLNEDDINQYIEDTVECLERKFGARLR
jgi:phenylalanyl-tRNA synthetase beta chain